MQDRPLDAKKARFLSIDTLNFSILQRILRNCLNLRELCWSMDDNALQSTLQLPGLPICLTHLELHLSSCHLVAGSTTDTLAAALQLHSLKIVTAHLPTTLQLVSTVIARLNTLVLIRNSVNATFPAPLPLWSDIMQRAIRLEYIGIETPCSAEMLHILPSTVKALHLPDLEPLALNYMAGVMVGVTVWPRLIEIPALSISLPRPWHQENSILSGIQCTIDNGERILRTRQALHFDPQTWSHTRNLLRRFIVWAEYHIVEVEETEGNSLASDQSS